MISQKACSGIHQSTMWRHIFIYFFILTVVLGETILFPLLLLLLLYFKTRPYNIIQFWPWGLCLSDSHSESWNLQTCYSQFHVYICVCVYVSVYLCSLCVMCMNLGMYEHTYVTMGQRSKENPTCWLSLCTLFDIVSLVHSFLGQVSWS